MSEHLTASFEREPREQDDEYEECEGLEGQAAEEDVVGRCGVFAVRGCDAD
tara:strand:+ start:20490 stop:20642 length:153 start_codon:yes stop_codon:yes gene_type:complete